MPAAKSRSRTPVSKVTPAKKATKTSARKSSASKSRSTTPVQKKLAVPAKKVNNAQKKTSVSNSRAVTPVKTVAKPATKSENPRKFYTVYEDNRIYKVWQQGTKNNSTVSDISKNLAKELGRSEESVRDRIKRYLSKLNSGDESRLVSAAKATPNHHIHFVNDKQGHPWKTIGKITSDDPSFNFKASSQKKAVVVAAKPSPRKASPVKPRVAAKSSSKSPAPKSPAPKSPAPKSPAPRSAKPAKSPAKSPTASLRKRSPPKSRSASRSTTPLKNQKKLKTVEKPKSNSKAAHVPTFSLKGVEEKELKGKVTSFLGSLKSKSNADVKKNAEVLAEVVKGFSSSYGVELSDVMTLLAKEKDGVNCARVRSQLENM